MANSYSDLTPPLVVGATGGSGTRVIARIAQRVGYFFGTNLNMPQDALEFLSFHDTWINAYVRAQDGQLFSDSQKQRMEQDFSATLARHLSQATDQGKVPGYRWGWKAPRSIYLLPYFHVRFPGMKFIHVIRDGRDMAFSKNQNQLRKNGKAVLSLRERIFTSRSIRSIMLWDRVNLRASAYAEKHLRDNYLIVRFEDLCTKPVETTQQVLRFMDVSADAEEIARAEISPPSSLGRWRSQPSDVITAMDRIAAQSLRKFGYLYEEDLAVAASKQHS